MFKKVLWLKYVTVMFVCLMWNTTTFGDDYFTLIQKIAVDDVGVYGQIDGNEFSKDNKYIIASDNHAKVKIYDRATGDFIGLSRHFILNNTSFEDAGKMNAVGFNHASTLFFTGLNDVGLKIFDFTTFIPNPTDDNNWPEVHHFVAGTEVDGADFSHNDHWLAMASDDDVKVYDMTTVGFPEVASFSIPKGAVNHLDFSFDDKYLAVCGNNGAVIIKNTSDWTDHLTDTIYQTGTKRKPSIKRIYFSPDATMYAVAVRRQICRVYRTSDKALLKVLLHKGNLDSIVCKPQCDDPDGDPAIETMHWGQNGKYLLTGGVIDGIVRCWRVDDWSLVATVRGQSTNRQIESLYVSSIVAAGVNQGHEMITGGDEGVLYHFNFHPPALKGRFKQTSNTICLDVLDHDASVPLGPDGAQHEWVVESDDDAIGGRCLRALPETNTTKNGNYATYDPLKDTPKLDYRLNITQTGNYYVWMRSKGNGGNNAIHVGIDGASNATSDKMNATSKGDFTWTKATKDATDARLNITSTGKHTLNVWMCEDGTKLDRVLLTLDGSYDPSSVNGGDGPAVSARTP